jgi:hypothetical protein
MSTALTLSIAAVLVLAAPVGSVKVTQRHLVPVCLDAAPVKPGTRSWRTGDAPMTLTFTMRNQPRAGTADQPAGYATVTLVPETGHRYEVEVRAAPQTFSRRVWPEGAWTPVVRDRADDRLIGGEPVWGPPPCAVASGQR